MDIIIGLISLISLIVFFVMGNNIGTLVTLNRTIKEQNFKIIELLKRSLPADSLTEEEKSRLYDQKIKEASKSETFAKYKQK
jgi:predicted Holliday junction resolvase-like endonuclease